MRCVGEEFPPLQHEVHTLGDLPDRATVAAQLLKRDSMQSFGGAIPSFLTGHSAGGRMRWLSDMTPPFSGSVNAQPISIG